MIALNDDIFLLILQAENEYHVAIKNAVKKAENYVDDCKKKQNSYIEDLKQDWRLVEKSENDKFSKMLSENTEKLENKMAESKKYLNISQKKKIDSISDRLKKEVISLYGNR